MAIWMCELLLVVGYIRIKLSRIYVNNKKDMWVLAPVKRKSFFDNKMYEAHTLECVWDVICVNVKYLVLEREKIEWVETREIFSSLLLFVFDDDNDGEIVYNHFNTFSSSVYAHDWYWYYHRCRLILLLRLCVSHEKLLMLLMRSICLFNWHFDGNLLLFLYFSSSSLLCNIKFKRGFWWREIIVVWQMEIMWTRLFRFIQEIQFYQG